MADEHMVTSQDESLVKRPEISNDSLTKEYRKGKNPSTKASRKGKGLDNCAKVGEIPLNLSDKGKQQQQNRNGLGHTQTRQQSSLADDVEQIKQQLVNITGSLASITPVITEIKTAYDNYNDQDEMSESDAESVAKCDQNESGNSEEAKEPPAKKSKLELKGVLADMAKVVNKPLCGGEDLNEDLAKLLTELLSQGASKESRDDLIEKLPTPANCQRLEVVRVNPEIFNSVKKEIKTDDVMLQKAQKPLLKGITAVAKVLTNLINDDKGKEANESSGVITQAMQTLSESLSLLCDASHEIDLRRRALFKSDMNPEYRLLCSDQQPVKELLFGTELGKSVKDLTEASKVTSKITSKQNNKRKSNFNSNQRSGQKRNFPFLNRGGGYAGKLKNGYAGYKNGPQKNTNQYQPRK